MSAPHLAFLDAFDWSTPARVGEDGRRYFEFSIPHRHPDAWFVIPGAQTRSAGDLILRDSEALDLTALAAELGIEIRAFDDDGDGIVVDPNATGDPGNADEEELGRELVSGIASSTSKDFFGTEMSLRALQIMALQMQLGRPYLPQHNHGMSGPVEWHEVIGRTVHAEVVPIEGDQIAKPHNPSEAQYILRATMQIIPIPASHSERDDSEKFAAGLLKRIARDEVIGQSIGGWFTRIQVIQNDEGDVERVIVQAVDLDHLAVTRAPANPDASGIIRLRSAIERSAGHARVTQLVAHLGMGRSVCVRGRVVDLVRERIAEQVEAGTMDPGTLAVTTEDDGGRVLAFGERHVVASVGTENTVIYQYLRGDATVDDLEPGELITDDGDGESRGVHDDDDDDDKDRGVHDDDDDKDDRAQHCEGNDDCPDGQNCVDGSCKGGNAQPAPTEERGVHDDDDDDDDDKSETYDTHEQIEAACSLSIEQADGRTIVSWADDEPLKNLRSAVAAILGGEHGEEVQRALRVATGDEDLAEDPDAPDVLDEPPVTVQDRGVTDALGSAPTDTTSPAGKDAGTSEEPPMPDLTLDAIRALFDEKLNPVIDRVQALEGGEDRTQPGGGDATEPDPNTAEGRLALAEARATAAEARAQRSEQALGDLVSQPHRVGRATLSIPAGPAAAGAYGGLIERAREDAPQFAALVHRALPILTGENLSGNSQSQRAALEDMLRAGLIAAENDGLITDPNIRAGWQ
jgi:hypothetical protein